MDVVLNLWQSRHLDPGVALRAYLQEKVKDWLTAPERAPRSQENLEAAQMYKGCLDELANPTQTDPAVLQSLCLQWFKHWNMNIGI